MRTQLGTVSFTETASRLWCEGYPALTADKPGLIGAVTDRAKAQTARLALIYAMLDGATSIDTPHLSAALAFWQYCDASARHIVAGRGENPLDEKIQSILRAGHRTSTAISEALNRNVKAADIKVALERLSSASMVSVQRQDTRGRPVTVFSLRSNEITENYEKSP